MELMRQRTDISLLLLDLMMPGMDGFDVLRVMKYHAWLDEIPVIVISAAEDTANIERAYDLGVACLSISIVIFLDMVIPVSGFPDGFFFFAL